MGSVYDIAYSFIENNSTTPLIFEDVVGNFNIILDMGWTESEIMQKLGKKKIDTSSVSLMTMFNKPIHPLNLLKSDTFYYHNMLRCMSKPPMQEWDVNAGTIVDIIDPYYLEMKASFTMHELINYYYKQMDLPYESSSFNRFKGAFEFLLKKLGIDLVLFMIDVARDNILSEDMPKPSTPVSVAEHEHEARERLNYKVSETKCTGDDKIVTRERVFSNRNGIQNPKWIQEEYNNYAW